MWYKLQMYFLAITILASAVLSDTLITFSWNKTKLAECMANQVLHFSDVLSFSFVDRGVATLIGEYVAGKVFGQTLTRNKLLYRVRIFKAELNRKLSERFGDEKNLVRRLSVMITNALYMCSDDDNPEPLPAFDNEIAAVGEILNYILVNWPLKLKLMIRTKKNRALLRKFINKAKQLLKTAMAAALNTDHFRSLLRMYWDNRAKRYYDGRDPNHSYLSHRYTLEKSTLHTNDDVDSLLFSNRSSQSIEVRSPILPQTYLKKVLNIHFADRPGFGEYDPFAIYKDRGFITSDQFYLESQIDDFYRLWFFNEALQAGGIVTNDDDVDENELRGHYDAQELITDDNKYRDFLLLFRIDESSIDTENPVQQSFSKRARVCEEELILLRMMNTPSTSGVTKLTKTSTSTTEMSVSTTPDDQRLSKRKNDKSCEDSQKNDSLKRPKTDNGCDKSDSKEPAGSTRSCNQSSDSLTNFKANNVFNDCFLIEILQQLQLGAECSYDGFANQKIF